MNKIRVSVIGVGNLGQHHARIYSEMSTVELTSVVDINKKQLEKISTLYNTVGLLNYQDILGKTDAVSIATPTPLHYKISKDFLLHNTHCLIEKPIATSVEEAEELISIAKERNLILQVGHIERFNPAIIGLKEYVKEPKFIETDRISPYDPRVSNVGVVLDLLIHDLDLVLYLVNSKVKDLEAYGTRIFSHYEDIVKVRLKFENGCVADLSASRAARGKYRKLRIFQPDAYITVDYTTQRARIYRKKIPKPTSMKDIEIISPEIQRIEPLKLELKHFIECIKEGKQPEVPGEHGRNAVELALEIIDKLQMY